MHRNAQKNREALHYNATQSKLKPPVRTSEVTCSGFGGFNQPGRSFHSTVLQISMVDILWADSSHLTTCPPTKGFSIPPGNLEKM